MSGVIYWIEVCGNVTEDDAFWSDRISVNTTNPDFTRCFQKTLISMTPCLYMWLACAVYIPMLCFRPTVNSLKTISSFNIFKTVVCLLLCALAVADLIIVGIHHSLEHTHSLADFLRPAILLVTYLLSAFLTHYEFRKGVHSGGVLVFFWLLSVLLNIVPFRSNITHVVYDDNNSPQIEELALFITFYIQYAALLTQFICSFFADLKAIPWMQQKGKGRAAEKQPLLGWEGAEMEREERPSPEKTAPFWQRLTFLWVTRLIIDGYRKNLKFKDLWNLMPDDKSEVIISKVVKHWEREVHNTGYRMVTKHQYSGSPHKPGVEQNYYSAIETHSDASKPTNQHDADFQFQSPRMTGDNTTAQPGKKSKKQKLPSIWNVIVKVFGPYYMIGGFNNLMYVLVTFLGPQLLNLLITFIGSGDPYVWRGYLYVVLLFVVSQCKTIFNQWYWHCCFVVGLRLRTAVIGIVYRKALKLNNEAKTKSTVGEIVNLMSVDAQKLQDVPGYLHLLWSAPVTIAIALYFLWQQLGPSVMAGFGLMLLFVPLNAVVAQKTRKLQIKQMILKDQRLKLMNEVLNGIKVLKLYAWENSFRDRLQAIRNKELACLKTAQYLSAVSAVSWFMAPYLARPIYFKGSRSVLSNFHPHWLKVSVDGEEMWGFSLEQSYQYHSAMYNGYDSVAQEILSVPPGEGCGVRCKQIANKKIDPKSKTDVWKKAKLRIIYSMMQDKLEQLPSFKRALLATDRPLIHPVKSSFWGTGGKDKDGLNMCGKLLMHLREGERCKWGPSKAKVALGSFATFVLSSETNILDSNKAFVSLSLFNIMNFPMSMLPGVIAFGVQASVSIGRINRFLRHEELDPDNVTENMSSEHVITVANGNFSWTKHLQPSLKNMNFSIPDGKLVAVVGQVGSGKSSLVSALLGDMEVMAGQVKTRGTVAYVPQQAWIQNASLRENILFEKPVNEYTYQKVLDACALTPDLQILPGGDQIEIGEKGINLSGGQKQRVSLARAVYQNSDIYLLDDPLSAVDAHVGKHIFEQVVGPTGILKHKTRVLVTNAVTFLPQVDLIICLKDGQITEIGSYMELLSHAGGFAEYIETYLNEASDDEGDSQSEVSEFKHKLKQQISILSGGTAEDGELEGLEADTEEDKGRSQTGLSGSIHSLPSKTSRKRKKTHRSTSVITDKEIIEKEEKKIKDKKLTEEEVAMTGSVKFSVLVSWIRSCGFFWSFCTMFFYFIYLSAQAATNIWLSEWSNDQPINGTQNLAQRNLRLGVYGGIGGLQAIGTLGQAFAMAVATVSSSKILHNKLLVNILRAPMSFFDTTPLGRIVNRFSKDVDTLDVNIPLTLRIWMGTMAVVFTTLFVISYSTPIFLVVLIPLGVFYFFAQRFYVTTSRQLRRIDSVKRSPIYVLFSESISGASSIRGYSHVQRFIAKSDRLIDENQMAWYPNIVSNRWLGVTLDFIGSLIVLFAGIFAVIQRETISPGLAGLSITYALQITSTLNVWVRMTSDLENYIVAVERLEEYADCPKEAPAIIEGNKPPFGWPDIGCVQFENYSTRYRPGLDLVLQNISCQIKPGEQIGVVGRTGAGKSSMTLALFRIIEAAAGKIFVDNLNIANMGLHDLRSKITIIPQDPVLFSGTLRMNLDPFEQYTDTEVWGALEQAHLKEHAQSLPHALQFVCSEGGENLSVGQRQLVCLARALLRRTRILVLDEATAAVDLETDDLIQTTIRQQFTGCTVITIAHRLNTIMDYNRVMVLDKGEIIELDTPTALLENQSSVFYSMASDAGLI